jgi:hypothetical protein
VVHTGNDDDRLWLFCLFFIDNDLMLLERSVADLGDRDFLCVVLHCVVTCVFFGRGLIWVIILPINFPRSFAFFASLLGLFECCFLIP